MRVRKPKGRVQSLGLASRVDCGQLSDIAGLPLGLTGTG